MVWWCGLDSSGLEQGPVVSSCEFNNNPLGFIKRHRISWPAERLSAYKKRTSFHEISYYI
jgi:hypothetical protein